METMYKTNKSEDAIHLFSSLPPCEDLDDVKADLIDVKKLNQILVMRNQFFYITDVIDFKNVFVSKTLLSVLGYQPSEFLDLQFVYNVIHPEDAEFVFAFTKKAISWSQLASNRLLLDSFSGVFSIDFRMRHQRGHYIRVNQQTSFYKIDDTCKMIYAISHYTDISHIKKSTLITYAWKTDMNVEFTLGDLAEQFHQSVLTSREVEIVRYLAQGFSATQISKLLFISEHTVITHRKNIIHKLKVKNSVELVKVALEMGVL